MREYGLPCAAGPESLRIRRCNFLISERLNLASRATMRFSSMIDRGPLRERESRRRAAGSKSQPCWPAIARQGHALHRSVWPHPDCDHDEGLHRSSAVGQFTADFLSAKVLVGGRPSPASFVTATIARATLPGFSDWRS